MTPRLPKTIETPRLILRRWKVSDKYDLYEYAQLDNVGPPAGWPPHRSVEESARIIRNVLSNPGTYCITLRTTGKVIGSLGLHWTALCQNDRGKNALELGYVLNPAYWGNGYTPEAAFWYISYAFEYMYVDELWCACFDFNEKSRRTLEKCGFTYMFDKKTKVSHYGNIEINEKVHILTRERFYHLTGRTDPRNDPAPAKKGFLSFLRKSGQRA